MQRRAPTELMSQNCFWGGAGLDTLLMKLGIFAEPAPTELIIYRVNVVILLITDGTLFS